MNTEKQRQCRCDDTRLTESRNARSEQLLMVPTELLPNREWLPGELLSGSECRRPGWFLEMKYQTCIMEKDSCRGAVYLIILCDHPSLVYPSIIFITNAGQNVANMDHSEFANHWIFSMKSTVTLQFQKCSKTHSMRYLGLSQVGS